MTPNRAHLCFSTQVNMAMQFTIVVANVPTHKLQIQIQHNVSQKLRTNPHRKQSGNKNNGNTEVVKQRDILQAMTKSSTYNPQIHK